MMEGVVELMVMASAAIRVVESVAVLVAAPSDAVIVSGYMPGVAIAELARKSVPKEPLAGCVTLTDTPVGAPVTESVTGFVFPVDRAVVAMMELTVLSAVRLMNDGVSERLKLSTGVLVAVELEQPDSESRMLAAMENESW